MEDVVGAQIVLQESFRQLLPSELPPRSALAATFPIPDWQELTSKTKRITVSSLGIVHQLCGALIAARRMEEKCGLFDYWSFCWFVAHLWLLKLAFSMGFRRVIWTRAAILARTLRS